MIWEKVKAFQQAFNLHAPDSPRLLKFNEHELMKIHLQNAIQVLEGIVKVPTTGLRPLRIKLLAEEMAEYLQAEVDDDLGEIADALTDIHYIAAGTEISYGLPGEEIFNHVHDNNMSKLGPDGNPTYRDDGKVMKPPSWTPPNVAGIVRNHLTRGT